MPNSNGWGDGTANNTIGWGQGSINNTIGWGSAYAVSEAGLTDIIGAPPAAAFVFDIDTSLGTGTDDFQLPLIAASFGTLNCTVDWGDGNSNTVTTPGTGDSHVYATGGTYTITITGSLVGWKFAFSGDCQKITDISEWGVLDITEPFAFHGCANLTCSATDAPTISTTNLSNTFNSATSFNGAIGNWDVSTVTNMGAMFRGASAFNQNIGTWDTSTVTNMNAMFQNATEFNQNISAWDVSQVSNFSLFMAGKSFKNYDAANLDAIYNTWSLLSLQYTLTIDFGTIKYTAAGQTGKDDLIFNYSWTVNDGGI